MGFNALGLDLGFAKTGWGVIGFDDTLQDPTLITFDVVTTEKTKQKKTVRVADDNYERAQYIAEKLDIAIGTWSPAIICAETMSFPRSSSVAAKMAMTWGVVAALAYKRGIPLVATSPQAIKIVLCSDKTASKEDIEAAVMSIFHKQPKRMMKLRLAVRSTLHEHAFDALAAVLAARNTEIMKALAISNRGK